MPIMLVIFPALKLFMMSADNQAYSSFRSCSITRQMRSAISIESLTARAGVMKSGHGSSAGEEGHGVQTVQKAALSRPSQIRVDMARNMGVHHGDCIRRFLAWDQKGEPESEDVHRFDVGPDLKDGSLKERKI